MISYHDYVYSTIKFEYESTLIRILLRDTRKYAVVVVNNALLNLGLRQHRYSCGINGRLQFYPSGRPQTQLVLDVAYDVLVGRTALDKGFQFVHVRHVRP